MKKDIKPVEEKKEYARCIFCKRKLRIDTFVGITKEGLVCGDMNCLMKIPNQINGKK